MFSDPKNNRKTLYTKIKRLKKGVFPLEFENSAYIFVGTLKRIIMTLPIKIIEIISLIATVFALFISIIWREKKFLLPIQFYIIICIIVEIVDLAFAFFVTNYSHPLLSAIQNIQTILEISLIYYFIYKRLQRKGF